MRAVRARVTEDRLDVALLTGATPFGPDGVLAGRADGGRRSAEFGTERWPARFRRAVPPRTTEGPAVRRAPPS
ncbi:hypothetical protein GCM10023238_17020 [Streptomyces heliomycini]